MLSLMEPKTLETSNSLKPLITKQKNANSFSRMVIARMDPDASFCTKSIIYFYYFYFIFIFKKKFHLKFFFLIWIILFLIENLVVLLLWIYTALNSFSYKKSIDSLNTLTTESNNNDLEITELLNIKEINRYTLINIH